MTGTYLAVALAFPARCAREPRVASGAMQIEVDAALADLEKPISAAKR